MQTQPETDSGCLLAAPGNAPQGLQGNATDVCLLRPMRPFPERRTTFGHKEYY